MKKPFNVILLITLMTLVFTSCSTPADKTKATATIVAEVTATPVPTATKVPAPTLIPMTKDEKGKPHPDAEVIRFEDFEDGEISENDFIVLYPENMDIKDGMAHIERVWSAISPIADYELGTKHNQYEFSLDFNVTRKDKAEAHNANWIGARVPEQRSADYPGGFWLAFNRSTTISVYPSGNNFERDGVLIELWAEKYFTITAPEDFSEVHKVTVIDTGDNIYFYMNTATEDSYLLLKVEFDGDELICYGNDGQQVFIGDNEVNKNINFSMFAHRSKVHVDNITLKGY